jgi:hypothetical protein
VYVNVSGGVSGKSNKGPGILVSGAGSGKSGKGYGINVSGVSSKSNKGYGINVSGVSSKSNKGYGINVSGTSSKSNKGASGIYINVAGGKSNKGTPVNPIQPIHGWRSDGFVSNINNAWQDDGFIETPAPTTWSGDAHEIVEPLPAPVRNDWSDDGWDDDKYPSPVKAAAGTNVYYVNVSAKSNKGYGINVSGVSSKSNKGYGINVSGVSAKSNKGYGISGSKSSGIYINVAGGKSNKGSSGFNINSSKSSKGPGQPVNPIQPADGWNHDGYVPVPVPVVRGKWSGDGHVTPLVTPNPTPRPTWKGDAHTSAPTACEERMLWHPNPGYTMCTNDSDYEPDSEYVYESLQMCCMSVFGTLSCAYDDICVEPVITPSPSPAPTTCEERKFYAIKKTDELYCSNGYDIPSGWTGSDYYFDDLQACCEAEFGSSSCYFEDVCNTLSPTESPTESPVTPAPTPCEAQVFFFDGNVCSNEFYIADASAYTSVMICCNINFGAGSFMNGSCDYVAICNTLEPTPNPTPNPTKKPTRNPTRKPSNAPIEPIVTPVPTESPVTPAPTPCEAQVFFFDGNVCSNEFYIADAPAYNTAKACCNVNFGMGSFMNGECNYVDECNTIPPSPSPVTPAPTPCEAKVFFFDGETCSNEFYIADAPSYISAIICCNTNFGSGSFINGSCNYVDECNTIPPTPSPTFISTFGSTPTVSKETTGPPTMEAGRDKITTDITTDCREITGGYPEVCVKVCTSIKSTFKGGMLIDETAETTEEECD